MIATNFYLFSHVDMIQCKPTQQYVLLTNPTLSASLHYQGSITHRFWTVLHDLPCSKIYKAYLCPKYALTPVWDRIDWVALGWSLRWLGQSVTTFSKYLHG